MTNRPGRPAAGRRCLSATNGLLATTRRPAANRPRRPAAGRYALRLLLLLLLPALTSCNLAHRMREKVRFEGVERIRPQGLTHLLLVLRATNDSAHNLKLKEMTLDFYLRDAAEPTLTATLLEPVTLRRRTSGTLSTKWRLDYADALAWLPLVRSLGSGRLDDWRVSVRLKGRSGVVPINILRTDLSVSQLLRTFGVDTNLETLLQNHE